MRQAQLRPLPFGSGGRGPKTRASAAPRVAATRFELAERLCWPGSQAGFNLLPLPRPRLTTLVPRATRSGASSRHSASGIEPARGETVLAGSSAADEPAPKVTPVSSLPDLLYLQTTRWKRLQQLRLGT